MRGARHAPAGPVQLSSPSASPEGGNEPSGRASSAEFDSVRPIPPREASGLSDSSKEASNVAHVGPTDGRADAGRTRAKRGPGGTAALPCQNSNNSNTSTKRYRLIALPGSVELFTSGNDKRALWHKVDGDTIERWGFPSGAEAKSAFHLRLNVASFVEHWGRDHCLFFTVTDEANLHPTKFARRWNSYLVRNGAWIVSFIRVLEPQKQGRPHYHLLVAVAWDTRADAFDWQSFDGCQLERRTNGTTARFRELRARYKGSAAPELVALWALLRKVLPRHGLGRAELLPLRKGKEAVSEYVGKYLEAGLRLRRHSWKGCRRVEFDRRAKNAWLACTRVFAWYSPRAVAWRKRVGEIGAALGVDDTEGIRRKLGPKWAYRAREAIILATDGDWRMFLSVIRVEFLTCEK